MTSRPVVPQLTTAAQASVPDSARRHYHRCGRAGAPVAFHFLAVGRRGPDWSGDSYGCTAVLFLSNCSDAKSWRC